jgi:hypothetical protein
LPAFSLPTDPSAGDPTSLGFRSLQRRPPGLPHEETSCPFSPRFRSRALTTPQRFPSTPGLRGSVSRRNRSWDPPFRVFPSQRSRAPLEAALLPCSCPPACSSAPPVALSPPVSSTSTLSRSCLTPRGGYELPFRGPRPTSRLLWAPSSRITTFCQLRLLRSLDPPANPFSTSPGCPVLAADTLLGFFPSRVFSNRALGPRPAQGDLSTPPAR